MKLKVLSLIFVSTFSFSLDVVHPIRPSRDYSTSTLNGSCLATKSENFIIPCSYANFDKNQKAGVSFSLVGKTDGDAIDTGLDLIFEHISEELIRKLFEQRNYNSFTFNGSLIFKTSLFDITYTPYYLLADLLIFNPAFPEISIHLVAREELRISRGKNLYNDKDISIDAGVSLFYYEHTFENTTFSLFEIAENNAKDLISFKNIYGTSGDLDLKFSWKNERIPNFSFQIKNIGSKLNSHRRHIASSINQSTLFLFETYSNFGLGKSISTKYGRFDFNYTIPFTSIYKNYHLDQSSFSIGYGLNLFSFNTSISKFFQIIGVKFDSEFFNIGINYSRERDLGKIQNTPDESVYTGIDIII